MKGSDWYRKHWERNSLPDALLEALKKRGDVQFVQSCKVFYRKNGFLSRKQLSVLRKITESKHIPPSPLYEAGYMDELDPHGHLVYGP